MDPLNPSELQKSYAIMFLPFFHQQQWLLFTVFAGIFIGVAILWVFSGKRNKEWQGMKLPPGPRGLPFIGNLHQIEKQPYIRLKKLAEKYGPIMFMRLGSTPTLVISSTEAAKEFMRTADLAFASRPPMLIGKYMCYEYKDVNFAPNGTHWREGRKLTTQELFLPKRADLFRSVREGEVYLMVQNIFKKCTEGTTSKVDISEAMSNVSMDITSLMVSGTKTAPDQIIGNGMTLKELIINTNYVGARSFVSEFVPGVNFLDVQGIHSSFKKLRATFDHYVEDILSSHERQPDLQSSHTFAKMLLCTPKDKDGYLSRETMKALMFDVFAAASESTWIATEWAMSVLLKYPKVLKKVQDELDLIVGKEGRVGEMHLEKAKYLQCTVKESMRLYPPGGLGLPHKSIEPCKVGEYEMPKGSLLLMNVWAIGRDPAAWEDAEEFKPERFMEDEFVDFVGHDLKSIPFSAGRRGCPGYTLAIPLVLLVAGVLAHAFEWEVDGDLDMSVGDTSIIARITPLVATPKLRVKAYVE